MDLPQWLKDLLNPITPQGRPTINRSAGKQLDQLEQPAVPEDPQARFDALSTIEDDDRELDERAKARQEEINRRLQKRQKTFDSIK